VDANHKFTLDNVGAYGKSSDGGTFERSPLGKKLSSNKLGISREAELTSAADSCPYVIVADEAFPLKPYLMHPYSKNSIVSGKKKYTITGIQQHDAL
jgi:hypothetical protein